MKITWWIISVCGLIVSAGMLLYIFQRPDVQTQRILNPTYFDDGTALGHILAERFYTDTRDQRSTVLGVSPYLQSSRDVWTAFVERLGELGVKWDAVYTIKGLPTLTNTDHEISNLAEVPVGQPGLRMLIQVPATEEWWTQVQMQTQIDGYVYFEVPYSNNPAHAAEIPFTCDKEKKTFQFGCAAIAASTRYYRKKLTENRFTAMMEKHPPRLFLLMISEPAH